MYQVCNYSDDLGGVEEEEVKAQESFDKLGWLLGELGLVESTKKAEPSLGYSSTLWP